MMLKWTVPVERGNITIKDGAMTKTIESLIEDYKPEAAYFSPDDGKRVGMMIFDMIDKTQLPQIAEPLFSNLNAALEFVPVMNADDLRQALQKIAT